MDYQNYPVIKPVPANNTNEMNTETGLNLNQESDRVHPFLIVESSTENKDERNKKWNRKMFYEIDDVPSWYMTIFLGFQHYLLMAGTTLSLPLLLMPKMCMQEDDRDIGNIISTYLFISGIVTILQTTFGTRLPIVQGGSFAYIVPAISILETTRWKCPEKEEIAFFTDKMKSELWKERMRVLQGAIIVDSLLQMVLGFFGVFGIIMRYISPITMASSIIMIGLSFFDVVSGLYASSWPISLTGIFLIILFSQYLRDVKIPIPFTKSKKRNGPLRYPLFQIFPVLLTTIFVWCLCAILTISGAFSQDHPARIDKKWSVIEKSELFRVPYPFQWGWPVITAGATIGFLSAVFAGIIESLGDYTAVARIVSKRQPPAHSINRGVFIEGFGCLLAGMFGTGNGTTSYSENIGAITLTKVGSRRVVQTAGFIMMVCSLVGKLGAFFMSIPDPIIGAILSATFSVIIAVGLSNLHSVDMTSTRNMFIIGFSIFFSLAVSKWIAVDANKESIKTGNEEFDYTIQILLSTGMFQAGLISLILDNTIPGTLQERGLGKSLTVDEDAENLENNNIEYDLPFGMEFLKRFNWTSWFPISPTFKASIYSNLFRNLFKKEK